MNERIFLFVYLQNLNLLPHSVVLLYYIFETRDHRWRENESKLLFPPRRPPPPLLLVVSSTRYFFIPATGGTGTTWYRFLRVFQNATVQLVQRASRLKDQQACMLLFQIIIIWIGQIFQW